MHWECLGVAGKFAGSRGVARVFTIFKLGGAVSAVLYVDADNCVGGVVVSVGGGIQTPDVSDPGITAFVGNLSEVIGEDIPCIPNVACPSGRTVSVGSLRDSDVAIGVNKALWRLWWLREAARS